MNTTTYSFEAAEMYGFADGARFAWVRYEVTMDRGITVGGDRRCVAVREFDSHGPVANFKAKR